MLAIIGFFLFEKCLNALGEIKEAKEPVNSPRDGERKLKIVREGHMTSDKARGENVCKNKYSNYCAKDLDMIESVTSDDLSYQAKTLLQDNTRLGHSTTTSTLAEVDQDMVIISQHEVVHHGHSHAHSHLHSAPRNISSVAWMVIFGDGIHNLADGLAIGAAFADGFMSGVSTTLAVLFHELPHEIGQAGQLVTYNQYHNLFQVTLPCC